MEFERIKNILEKYFEGESSIDEEKELKKYFTEVENIPPEFQYAKELFSHLKSGKKEFYHARKKFISVAIAVAAGILLMFGLFFIYKYSLHNNDYTENNQISQKNETDKIRKIILSDNNTIWLNKNCEISYPKTTKEAINKITVNGEAYFEILNVTSKYQIYVNNTVINVEVPASFNIKAEAGMACIEVTVDSGIIKVLGNNNPEGLAVLVNAGHYCSVHKSQKLVYTSVIKNQNYIAWKTGEFRFDNVPVATVANVLSEYYNVRIEFQNRQIAYCEFSGTFKNRSLDFILSTIKSQLNFKITSTGDVIKFSGTECM